MHRDKRLSTKEKALEDELAVLIDAFVDDLSSLVKKEYEGLLDSIYISLSDDPSSGRDAACRMAISLMKDELHDLSFKRVDSRNEIKDGREGQMSKPRRR